MEQLPAIWDSRSSSYSNKQEKTNTLEKFIETFDKK
jgi:hypothetical protein